MTDTPFDFTGLAVKDEQDPTEFGFVIHGPAIDSDVTDAAFFCDGMGSNLVAVVQLGNHAVQVRCDGQMRAEDGVEEERYTYAEALISAGYRTDDELYDAEKAGILYFENNPWFDLYDDEDGTHLDYISHDYPSALEAAMNFLLDDNEDE